MISNVSNFSSINCQRVMLADSNRLAGYTKAIIKHCPGKKVLDFGAGTGILGILAFVKGKADEVTFCEQNENLHPYIIKNAAANYLTNYNIVSSVSELPQNYFDVCLSETLGDNVLEESILQFNQIILDNPNCIAIPDSIHFKHEYILNKELDDFHKSINSSGITLDDSILNLIEPMVVKLYGIEKDHSKEFIKFDLYSELPNISRHSLKLPKSKNANGALLWWQANTKGEYVTSNSPHLFDNGFNHWNQTLLSPNSIFDIELNFAKGTVSIRYKNSAEYVLGY